MKDVNQLGTQYFDIPTKEIANHITKWLATFKFKERGNDGWTDKNKRIFFTSDNEYLFTDTEDIQNWKELYNYGMPEYTDNQISTSKNTLTEDNIRDFYFEVNNQTEADDALEILEKAGEGIYIKGLAFLYDSWRYIIYENGNGWKLSCKSIGKRSTYQELVDLYKPSTEQSHFNVNINGSEETIKPNSATSPKKVSDLKYPDVIHIQTKEEHAKIKSIHCNINNWKSTHHYYLIGQGFAEKRKSYENSEYTIYEMDQIIIDTPAEQPKTSDMEIFPGIKIGDIVVSLIEIGQRKVGDMFEVLPESKKGYLYYLDFANCSDFKTFRLATYKESEEYEKGIRNINKILPVETILEKANKMYPIGTKVKLLAGTDGEEVEAIIKEKFILYDNGSVSYRSLPGYVYSSRTNEWARIVKEGKNVVKADVESTSKTITHDFKVGDYVKIVTLRDERLAYKKILGEVFQVTEVYNTGILNKYVKGYKESYPHLFNTDTGVFMTDIELATQDEINQYNLEKAKRIYPPGTIIKWEDISSTEIVPSNPEYKIYSGNEIGVPYMTYFLFNEKWAKVVGVAHMPENLSNLPNDVDLKCKTSKQYINTTIASIPTINKELKQKKQKFYF